MIATTDLLSSLGERGWAPVDGGGWRNEQLDVTVRQVTPSRYTIDHAGRTREVTSATGVLCCIDQLAAKAAE